jgi:signal transduction histidine kinase
VADELPALDEQRETVLYRVAQEAITNALRHSGSTDVTVRLAARPRGVVLEVRDRGSGFDPDHTSGGLGLDSMRERAASVGGTLAITSTEGNGTSVRLTVPRTPARRGER